MRLLDHLTEEEFWQERQKLSGQEEALKRALSANEPIGAIEPVSSMISFAQLAQKQFLEGDSMQKRSVILKTVSNLVVKDKILRIEAKKPYQLLLARPKNSDMSAWLDDVRKNLTTGASQFHSHGAQTFVDKARL